MGRVAHSRTVSRSVFLVICLLVGLSFQNCGGRFGATRSSSGDGLSFAPVTLPLNTSKTPSNFAPNVSCRIYLDGAKKLWLESVRSGETQYRFRIGSAGVISDILDARDNRQMLGTPRLNPDYTDSVVQSVIWSGWNGIAAAPNSLPPSKYGAADDRFNINQAGNIAQLLTPTLRVEVDYLNCTVDVYSAPQDQWFPELQGQMQGLFGYFSRYQLQGEGELYVRQIAYQKDVNLASGATYRTVPVSGPIQNFWSLLLNYWFPVSPDFPNLALGFDNDAKPNWYFNNSNATSSLTFADRTYGYATAFSLTRPSSISLVYGNRKPTCAESNCLATFKVGAAPANSTELIIGTAFELDTAVPMESIVDISHFIVPSRVVDKKLVEQLTRLASALPAPKILGVNQIVDPSLAAIAQNLVLLTQRNSGVRTDTLGTLVTPHSSIAANCTLGSLPMIHNTVGAPNNGDPRFHCFNGRLSECGWEMNDPQNVTKASDRQQIGSYFCDLPSRRWRPASGIQGTENCSIGANGIHNSTGFVGGSSDVRFLCLYNRWYDCNWELSDPNWETKVSFGQRVGSYTCDPQRGWILETSGTGVGDCSYGMNPGKHDSLGAANNDTRFSCLSGRWYDCGWNMNDPSWETKVPVGKRVGSFVCSKDGHWIK